MLAVGTFASPARYRDSDVRVIFLMGLPEQVTSEDSLLIRVYEEIIRVTKDEALMEKVVNAEDFQALLHALYRQA